MSLVKIIRPGSREHQHLSEYIAERLTKYRQQIESTDIPLEKVPGLRARIAELKALHQSINEEPSE